MIDSSLDGDDLMRQAIATADTYLHEAIRRIDEVLGKDYAKQHPELIAAFMQVAAKDFGTAVWGQIAETSVSALADALIRDK